MPKGFGFRERGERGSAVASATIAGSIPDVIECFQLLEKGDIGEPANVKTQWRPTYRTMSSMLASSESISCNRSSSTSQQQVTSSVKLIRGAELKYNKSSLLCNFLIHPHCDCRSCTRPLHVFVPMETNLRLPDSLY
jgi:hypothetical protein